MKPQLPPLVIAITISVLISASNIEVNKDQPVQNHASIDLNRRYLHNQGQFLLQSIHRFKRDSQSPPNENVILATRLDGFVERLRSFINDTHFDVESFDDQFYDLKKVLSEISCCSNKINRTKELHQQLRFSKHMFRAMTESITLMKRFKPPDTPRAVQVPGYLPIYEIIELNVIALAMNNSYGELDVSIESYKKKILLLWRRLRFWKEEFKEVENVPSEIRRIYNIQVDQVETNLESLQSFHGEN
ncbi:hypothetical protein JCM33374_g5881 [Metschnikowia sp. JCM 33374]|nr:hypothetical protein JCM33374_g5881 [Metschnikowia sp. JCM 33374]